MLPTEAVIDTPVKFVTGLDPIVTEPREEVEETPLMPTTSAGEIDPTAEVEA